MSGPVARVAYRLSHRWLLILAFVLGLLTLQAGAGTVAFYTSTANSSPNQFTAGTLDVTTSTLGSGSPTAFSWTTSRGGTNCSTTMSTGTLITGQRMAPGYYCNAPITLVNSGNVDAWMRLRIVRTAGSGPASEALNRALVFYMSEYANATNNAVTAQQARDADCGTGTLLYKPSTSTNAGVIANIAAAGGVAGRTALLSLGSAGKSLGATQLTSGSVGLGLTSNSAVDPPTEASMAANTYANLIGNDGVADPGGSYTAEANLPANTTRYYCAAMFFPSDSALGTANGAGDNQAQAGDLTYALQLTAAQKSGRALAAGTPGPTATTAPTATATPTPSPTPTASPTPATPLATVSVGYDPRSVALNASANKVYVANFGSSSNSVSVIDTVTNAVATSVPVGSGPQTVAVNPSTNKIYVANLNSNSVSVIDGGSNTVDATLAVGTNPHGVAVNASTNRIYVANWGSNSVSVISGASNSVVGTVSVGAAPQGVAVNASTNRLYVANSYGNSVSVIDGTSNSVVATVAVGSEPYGVAVNETTNKIYVTNYTSNTVSVIDGVSNTVASTVAVGTSPTGVAVNASTNRLYVTNMSSSTVSVIDGSSNTVATTLNVGASTSPISVAVNATTNKIYVLTSGSVSVYDG